MEGGREVVVGRGSGSGFQVGSAMTRGVPGATYEGGIGDGRAAATGGGGVLRILRVVVVMVTSSSTSSSSGIGTATTFLTDFALAAGRLRTVGVGEGGKDCGKGMVAGAIDGGRVTGAGMDGIGSRAGTVCGRVMLTMISG